MKCAIQNNVTYDIHLVQTNYLLFYITTPCLPVMTHNSEVVTKHCVSQVPPKNLITVFVHHQDILTIKRKFNRKF